MQEIIWEFERSARPEKVQDLKKYWSAEGSLLRGG
jgi:hypothetical protein